MIRLLIALAALLMATTLIADDDENTSRKASISKTIELKLEFTSGGCEADANLDYFQRGIEVQVETVIETQSCDAASGEYIVKVTVLSETETDTTTLTFEDAWEQVGGLPAESMRRYAIGNDVDLKRVRIRKLSCTCTSENE